MFLRPYLAIRLQSVLAVLLVAVLLVTVLLVAGCSSGQTYNQAIDKALANAGKTRSAVYPLAGKIKVDGVAPDLAEGEWIVMMLKDPANPKPDGPYRLISRSGEFAFRTFAKDDGVKAGTYIATFSKLKRGQHKEYPGPDEFNNLYDDPDRNLKEYPELKINHQPPGKKDYVFDLKIAGREAVAAGPNAVTHFSHLPNPPATNP
jgi:outer membrane murein-binding lipoprotein Lpp